MIKEIVEQWHEENFTIIDETAQAALIAKLEREFIARAVVAAALRKLQTETIAAQKLSPEESGWQDGLSYIDVRIDATIAALGIAPGNGAMDEIERLAAEAKREQKRADLARAMGWAVKEFKHSFELCRPDGTFLQSPFGDSYPASFTSESEAWQYAPNPYDSAEDSRALCAWLRSQSDTQTKMHGRFCRNLLTMLDLEIEGEYYWRIVDELLNAPLPVIAEAAWRAMQMRGGE